MELFPALLWPRQLSRPVVDVVTEARGNCRWPSTMSKLRQKVGR